MNYSIVDSASSRRGAAAASGGESTEARSKFGNAKAISSDMFQSGGASPRDPDYRSRLTRFEGQNAISSADLFGDGDPSSSRNRSNAGMQNPDFNDLKDSLREGATKVASKLSSVASSVMGSIQVRALSDLCLFTL